MSTKTDWSHLTRTAVQSAHAEEIRDYEERLKKHEEAIKALAEQLDVALAVDRKRPKHIRPIEAEKGSETEAVAVALASDWHVEEVVRGESVNGLNEFNLGIAEKRIAKFFDGIKRLTEIEREGVEINTLILWLGGDFMSGYIHEELQESNELSPVQTIVWLRDRMLAGIQELQDKGGFNRIVVPCCYGNHGRTTRKPRFSTGAANSNEWLLYQILAKHLPSVEWHIAEGYHTYVEVFGKMLRFHHGDGLQYQGGIGGLTIPVEKAIASWNKGKVADLDCFGHWHQYQQNPKWCSNGSLIGYNAFALQIKAAYEPPQQTFFLLDSKRGRTVTAPITLS
jgi:hypothetical protein